MFSYSLSIACIKFSIEKAFCQEILLKLALWHFVTSDYTLENYTDLYSPKVGPRNGSGSDYFKESVDKEMDRLLTVYQESPPVLEEETRRAVEKILAEAGIEAQEFEKIRAL